MLGFENQVDVNFRNDATSSGRTGDCQRMRNSFFEVVRNLHVRDSGEREDFANQESMRSVNSCVTGGGIIARHNLVLNFVIQKNG